MKKGALGLHIRQHLQEAKHFNPINICEEIAYRMLGVKTLLRMQQINLQKKKPLNAEHVSKVQYFKVLSALNQKFSRIT